MQGLEVTGIGGVIPSPEQPRANVSENPTLQGDSSCDGIKPLAPPSQSVPAEYPPTL